MHFNAMAWLFDHRFNGNRKQIHGTSQDPASADLIAGMGVLFNQADLDTVSRQVYCRRCAGRSTAHNGYVICNIVHSGIFSFIIKVNPQRKIPFHFFPA
jgi:hypothetical protein